MRIPEPTLNPALRFPLILLLGIAVFVVVWWPMFYQYPGPPIADGHYFFPPIAVNKAAPERYPPSLHDALPAAPRFGPGRRNSGC